ncbi:MAG: DUF3786 domain-containing protein [Desulfitobacteriaceae bacterium]
MNYTAAHQAALVKFRASSLEEMAKYSQYPVEENRFQVNFLGQVLTVEYPSGNFEPEPTAEGELPIFAQILILHYLSQCSDIEEQGKLISYKEIPGGSIYIQPFTNRAIRPLVQLFGDNPRRLMEIAEGLGGKPVQHGDTAVTIRVFPRIPLTLVLWEGDEEFPPTGNILFDASAASMLPTEDYAVLASFVVGTLKRQSVQSS